MALKLVAKNDRIIIKPTEKSVQEVNGYIIPDQGKEKPEMGIVISVGPGVYSVTGQFVPTTIKVGETILVPKFGASQIDFEGEEYYITQEKEVIAGLEEDLLIKENDFDSTGWTGCCDEERVHCVCGAKEIDEVYEAKSTLDTSKHKFPF